MNRSNICPKCGAQTTYTRVKDGRGCMACERGVPLDQRTSPPEPEPEPEPTLEERVEKIGAHRRSFEGGSQCMKAT